MKTAASNFRWFKSHDLNLISARLLTSKMQNVVLQITKWKAILFPKSILKQRLLKLVN